MNNRLALVGGGGFAKEVNEAAELSGYKTVGYVADGPSDSTLAYLGDFDWLESNRHAYDYCMMAFGAIDRRSIARRVEIIRRFEAAALPFATVISPHAMVSASATIGAGTYVGHGAIILPDATVGRHVIINVAVIISHDVVVGDGVVAAPAAFVGGNSKIGPGTLLGPAAQVLQGRTVGSQALVGVGAIVFDDLADGGKRLPGEPRKP